MKIKSFKQDTIEVELVRFDYEDEKLYEFRIFEHELTLDGSVKRGLVDSAEELYKTERGAINAANRALKRLGCDFKVGSK